MADGTPRAADVLAARLYEAGCRFAFGMPGGEVLTLVDALEKAGIRFILAKHENSAGFMAEGVWHRTGAPGILVATVGPGALNCVNVAANAEQDRVPLIILTGCVDEDEALTYTHQVLDHRAVFEPVVKKTWRLTANGADNIADRAVSVAQERRAGPVHVDVPISVADAPSRMDRKRRRAVAAPTVPVGDGVLEQARTWIGEAERPVMVVGLDALRDRAGGDIREFAERFGIPFVTTYKAKGLVDETHPLCLGGAGLSPLADGVILPLVRDADLVICAGYDPIEMRTGWREVWDPETVNVIDISAVANDHYMHQATVSFVADTGATLRALGQDVPPRETWADGRIATVKRQLAEAFPVDDNWGPAGVIAECRAVLPPETIATVDSGAHRILLSQMWTCREPAQLLQSSGLCTMGCAVPLAIGAKIAEPEKPVICFAGDAGTLMVLGEMTTAAEMGLNVIFVVFVDASLALIELKQRQRQLTNAGVDFGAHDFAAMGQAMGGDGYTVHHRGELRTALSKSLESNRFSVIAAVVDRKGYDGRI